MPADDGVRRDLLAVVSVEWLASGLFDELLVGVDGIAFDRTAVATGGQDVGKAAVDGSGEARQRFAECPLRVDDPVDRHGSEAAREPLGVAQSDQGAVGEADVGDRVASEGEADGLDVLDGVGRADVLRSSARSASSQLATRSLASRSTCSWPSASTGARSTVRNHSASWSPHSSDAHCNRPTAALPAQGSRGEGER